MASNTRVLNHSSHCLLLEAPFTQTWGTCRSLFPEVIINVWAHFVYVKHHLFCTLLVLGRKHVLTLEEARWQHRSNFKFIHICFELINNFRNYKNVIKMVWRIPAHPRLSKSQHFITSALERENSACSLFFLSTFLGISVYIRRGTHCFFIDFYLWKILETKTLLYNDRNVVEQGNRHPCNTETWLIYPLFTIISYQCFHRMRVMCRFQI